MATAAAERPAPAAALQRTLRGVATVVGFYAIPLALGIALAGVYDAGHHDDFQANVWLPAQAVLHGHSPYPAPDLASLVGHRTFVYPPVLLWLDVPLSLLGHTLARLTFTLLCVAGAGGALRLLGVRDHRVYALALLGVPAIQALVLGNPTLLLLPVLAAAWRWRERPWVCGCAVALIVACKPLLWPLLLWLAVTRRLRTALIACAAAAIALLGTWAAIGFDGMLDYPALVRLIGDKTAGPRGLSITTLVTGLGGPHALGRILQTLAGLGLLAAAAGVARRADGDRRAFTLALCGALVLSPVAWLHYLALLYVPLAVARPAFDRLWAATALLWLTAFAGSTQTHLVMDDGVAVGTFGVTPTPLRVAVTLGVLATLAVALGAPPRIRASRAPSSPPA